MRYSLVCVILLCGVLIAGAQDKNSKGAYNKNRSDLQQRDFFDFSQADKQKKEYTFGVEYRIETGYIQNYQRSAHRNYPQARFYGGGAGVKIDLLLPYHFSVQLGLTYAIAYGKSEQHYHSILSNSSQKDYISNRIMEHQLLIPARLYYTQPLVKKWRLLFYGGPQLLFNAAQINKPNLHLTTLSQQWATENNIVIKNSDLTKIKKIRRCALQLGMGGGFEWNYIRLTGGYDFGVTNLVKSKKIYNQHMWEWTLHVSVGFKIGDTKKNKVNEEK